MSADKRPDIRASEIADACVKFLGQDPGQLADFMAASGLGPAEVRAQAQTEAFALGVMDYFARNEDALLALCANAAIAPESFMRAWYRLNPGR